MDSDCKLLADLPNLNLVAGALDNKEDSVNKLLDLDNRMLDDLDSKEVGLASKLADSVNSKLAVDLVSNKSVVDLVNNNSNLLSIGSKVGKVEIADLPASSLLKAIVKTAHLVNFLMEEEEEEEEVVVVVVVAVAVLIYLTLFLLLLLTTDYGNRRLLDSL